MDWEADSFKHSCYFLLRHETPRATLDGGHRWHHLKMRLLAYNTCHRRCSISLHYHGSHGRHMVYTSHRTCHRPQSILVSAAISHCWSYCEDCDRMGRADSAPVWHIGAFGFQKIRTGPLSRQCQDLYVGPCALAFPCLLFGDRIHDDLSIPFDCDGILPLHEL